MNIDQPEGTAAPADTPDLPSALPGDAVQQQLPLDEPVPYRLTAQGRRLVAPDDLPVLRVVDLDAPRHVDLDRADGAVRARARALRLAGSHTLDIADELGVDPLHVEAWVADLPVPADAGVQRRRGQLRAVPDVELDVPSRVAATAAWRAAADEGRDEAERRLPDEPWLRGGLGVVSGVLEADHHALLLCGDQVGLIRAAWAWTVSTLSPTAPARVLLSHDPAQPGDRVAHEVGAALGIPVESITATRDPARAGRGPWVRLRVSDPVLAGRAEGWRRALLAEVEQGAG